MVTRIHRFNNICIQLRHDFPLHFQGRSQFTSIYAKVTIEDPPLFDLCNSGDSTLIHLVDALLDKCKKLRLLFDILQSSFSLDAKALLYKADNLWRQFFTWAASP